MTDQVQQIQRKIGSEEQKLADFMVRICQADNLYRPMRLSFLTSLLTNPYLTVVAYNSLIVLSPSPSTSATAPAPSSLAATAPTSATAVEILLGHALAIKAAHMLDRLLQQLSLLRDNLRRQNDETAPNLAGIDQQLRSIYIGIIDKIEDNILQILSSKRFSGLIEIELPPSATSSVPSSAPSATTAATTELPPSSPPRSLQRPPFPSRRHILAEIPLRHSPGLGLIDLPTPQAYNLLCGNQTERARILYLHFIKLFIGNAATAYEMLGEIEDNIKQLTSICPNNRRSVLEFMLQELHPQELIPDLEEALTAVNRDNEIPISPKLLLAENVAVSPQNIFKRLAILLSVPLNDSTKAEHLVHVIHDARQFFELLLRSQHQVMELHGDDIQRLKQQMDASYKQQSSIRLGELVRLAVSTLELLHKISPLKDADEVGRKVDKFNLELQESLPSPTIQEHNKKYTRLLNIQLEKAAFMPSGDKF